VSEFLFHNSINLKYDTNAKLLFCVCFAVYRPNAPEPPVVSEIHATSCTVIYQPPRDDGGAPVTGYILERRTPGPDSKWIRVNDTPVTDLHYTIDNLTPATEYEFRVAAVNKKRRSMFSVMSWKVLTVEKPDRPGLPEVIDVTGTSVRLQWTVPDSDGGADITEYIVMYRTSHVFEEDEEDDYELECECVALSADANMEPLISYTIRNQLQANTKYNFQVAAVNRMGQGPWSNTIEYICTFDGMLNIS